MRSTFIYNSNKRCIKITTFTIICNSNKIFHLKKLGMRTAQMPWIGQVQEWPTDNKITDYSCHICKYICWAQISLVDHKWPSSSMKLPKSKNSADISNCIKPSDQQILCPSQMQWYLFTTKNYFHNVTPLYTHHIQSHTVTTNCSIISYI